MSFQLAPRFYYLTNFHKALTWLGERYGDLLLDGECAFLDRFPQLDTAAQALLVRMIMRKGPHFRVSKLAYEEIGCSRRAAESLLAEGWVVDTAEVSLDELFALLRKDEILASFRDHALRTGLKKPELRELLAPHFPEPRSFALWCPQLDDPLYSLAIAELCERLRLMFFGNLHQDWSEFVLADLGIFRYEQVPLTDDARGFRSRDDVDAYLHLRRCREQFEAGEPIPDVLERIGPPAGNPHLAERRARLLYLIGQQQEREADLDGALAVYQMCDYPGARLRRIRVLERGERFAEAHALAQQASREPENDAEAQRVERALARLDRQLGLPVHKRPAPAPAGRLDLHLPRRDGSSVEQCVQLHLSEPHAPVHYVENTLICSLFGLLCWEAIFAPLPGAFFHPFHVGPVDLLRPDFQRRRAERFAACLALLDTDAYHAAIRDTYAAKFGLQSPFVYWNLLTEELLDQALACLPAAHLKAWFQRLLGDIQANRAGMPDLIQFWPAERRYRMIEVKGPGDRLQDNQRRWLAFCAEHGMPVDICYVQWADA